MIVVSDTSAISNLITIEQVHLLAALFGEVIIPPAVERELRASHINLPAFLRLRTPQNLAQVEQLTLRLDRGEAEAITLAKEIRADRLLIDEKDGRRIAQQEGLSIIGVLGLLLLARKSGLIATLRDKVERLEEAGFYLDQSVKAAVLRAAGE